jgi:hypothetical protein
MRIVSPRNAGVSGERSASAAQVPPGAVVAATADNCEAPDGQAVLVAAGVRAQPTLARLKGIDEPVRLFRISSID